MEKSILKNFLNNIILIFFFLFTITLFGCEDDPILESTSDSEEDGGSYGNLSLPNDDVNLNSITLESGKEGHIYKKQFSKNEYFLIENRNNWYRDKVSIDSARYYVWENTGDYPSFIKILIDSTDVVKNQYGVITQVPNYNLGLPGSGLLIWHIDEEKIKEGIDSFSIKFI